jgi:hypothetical protein
LQRGLSIFATHCSSISVRHAGIQWVVSYKCHCRTSQIHPLLGSASAPLRQHHLGRLSVACRS